MTAEIAILNKTAVAMAADSAVTISAGRKQEKVFDSADKLFELSQSQPIGVMVYNTMSFMEIPLPPLIKEFRGKNGTYKTVEKAAESFRLFLNEVGQDSSVDVKKRVISSIIYDVLAQVQKDFEAAVLKKIVSSDRTEQDYSNAVWSTYEEIAQKYINAIKNRKKGTFVGQRNGFVLSEIYKKHIHEVVDSMLAQGAPEKLRKMFFTLSELLLRRDYLSSTKTGIVIAGFGGGERFPTLCSYEMDGVICNNLKYVLSPSVDIDRDETKAAIVPFAQKDMIDRFVFGLDLEVKKKITEFCEATVPEFRESVIGELSELSEARLGELEGMIRSAERKFLRALSQDALAAIDSEARKEIEGMVEFMPKPEMARMAESLIELTSIKRRVSRGIETVGGPIDVAVISREEGFVWVKRKHYFSEEYNARYYERVKIRMRERISEQEGEF